MITKEAFDALIEGTAIQHANASLESSAGAYNDARGIIAMPSDFKIHDIETHLPTRRRQRGYMQTSHSESFADYVAENAELGATIFVNKDSMSAEAVLNLGTPNWPGHCDNKATLLLEKTAAYKALLAITGTQKKQKDVAEWLEDWHAHITCAGQPTDGTIHSAVISPISAANAVRSLTIESWKKLESTTEQLSSSLSSFASETASSKTALPTTVYFTCQPYSGLNERIFTARISVTSTNNKPMITLRIVQYELHTEQMAEELAGMVTEVMSHKTKPLPEAETQPAKQATEAEFDVLEIPSTQQQTIPVLLGSYSAAR